MGKILISCCCCVSLWRGVFFFFFPPLRQLIYGRGLSQPFSITRCSFTLQCEIQSAFKNLSLAPHPPVLPVLGDVCSSLLFFPWDVWLRARRRPGSSSSMALDKARLASLTLVRWCCRSLPRLASWTSSSPVVCFLIWFSFSLFMLLKTYSRLLERTKMPCYHFSHTHFFSARGHDILTLWVE